jgi:hypothetical protein
VENPVLEAEDYYTGKLDWFSFNHNLSAHDTEGLMGQDAGEESDMVTTEVRTLIPSEARFGGMPNSRWWEFEDGYTDLGNINAETTDLAKVLLAEFALMYSNDWFVIPYNVPAGTLSEVKGIIVTDTFGERTLVEGAGQGDTNDWTSWTMFNMTKSSSSENAVGKVDPRIFVPPVVSKVQESEPVESVELVRDEMANMVWGVESTIPDLMGSGRDGNSAAIEFRDYLNKMEDQDATGSEVEIPEDVKLQYKVGNTVPENWIPFLPTHLDDENRAIKLQRASMPRWYNGDFSQIRPRTSILRYGM